jgi:hypothetical protein
VIHNHLQPGDAPRRADATPRCRLPKWGRACRRANSILSSSPKSNWKPARSRAGDVRALAPSAAWRAGAGVLHAGAGRQPPRRFPRLDHDRKIGRGLPRLHDQGVPISVSINVDQSTLAHPQFMEQIAACPSATVSWPDYITFEMTESAVLSTEPHFLERLLRLRMKGFGLAIDDYGTGRSNLQLLARIPFSELKIDRSFVDGASKRAAIGTVLRSCLGLARSLDRSRWASRPSRTGTSCKAGLHLCPRLLHRQAHAGRRIPRGWPTGSTSFDSVLAAVRLDLLQDRRRDFSIDLVVEDSQRMPSRFIISSASLTS